jgi:hypothetical protein
MTADNRIGILADAPFEHDIAAAMFEAESGYVWLEYTDMAGTFDLNIPAAEEYFEPFRMAGQFGIPLELGVYTDDQIEDAVQLPVAVVGGHTGMPRLQHQASRSILRFEHFMKSVISGQPLHRDNLGDEDSASGIAADVSPAALELAPQLQRQRQLEAAPKTAPQAGPNAPGLGGAASGGGAPVGKGQQGGSLQAGTQRRDTSQRGNRGGGR